MKRLLANLLLLAFAVSASAQDSVTTLAGQALVSGAANGVGTNALFSDPAAVVVDAGGNLFVADSQNHAIRKITTKGVVTTFAGQLGICGSANGSGTNAQFNSPSGLAFDAGGNLFVGDTGNSTIRKITPAGIVSTIAGIAGQSGFADGATGSAQFNSPLGIAVATNSDAFVADSGNHCIRRISGGAVTTFAGSPQVWGSADGQGTNARFNGPVGLILDGQRNLFVSDSNNHTVRKISSGGSVTTFAGVASADGCVDGDARTARFCKPAELALDSRGNLFVADSFNHVIRKISSDGRVSTVSGAAGNPGAVDGFNGRARFFNPYGLAVSPGGALIVADAYNELFRVVLPPFSLVIQRTNGIETVTIRWDGVIGQTYQVQFKDSPASAAWSNLGAPSVAASQNLHQVDSAPGTGAQRIYRVIIP